MLTVDWKGRSGKATLVLWLLVDHVLIAGTQPATNHFFGEF